MSQTQFSCPRCGTSLKTCTHCVGYRAHEVARLLREQANPVYVAPPKPKRSCPYCGGETGCYHCGVRSN